MKRYEYKVEIINMSNLSEDAIYNGDNNWKIMRDEMKKILDNLGNEGWNLIEINQTSNLVSKEVTQWIFKREI